MPAAPRTFTLQCHPATPCAAARALAVSVAPDGAADWRLTFVLTGDIARLRVPAPTSEPAASDGLWQRTCFEAFAGDPRAARYHEFNFSPSGDWAAYVFSAERLRETSAAPLPPPRIACASDARSLRLDAWLPAAALPATADGWRLGLAAVVESAEAGLSYWALAHPAARPDFHRREGWIAQLSSA
ncbi:MAG: DOMON-like domain-containing protein [Desulfovibrionaceae bacterium]|jgi:hypothetical protein|nr:DOMON-like domain-containing protein [Desulfovibrionaceae bacterium]